MPPVTDHSQSNSCIENQTEKCSQEVREELYKLALIGYFNAY